MSKSQSFFKNIPPKAKQMNKPLIAAIFGLAFMVLLIAFWNSVTETPNFGTSSVISPAITSKKEVAKPVDWVGDLPDTYQEAQKIDQYLAKRFPERGNAMEAQALKVQMQALENSQKSLKAQLEQMRQKSNNPISKYNDYLDREAMSSAIFFAGGSPHPEEKTAVQPDDSGSDQEGKAVQNSVGSYPPPYYPRDSYEGQNMQKDKLDFLGEKVDADIYNQNNLQKPVSKYVIQAGTVIPGILQTKIVSDLPGVITAVVRNHVYDSVTGRYLLIPKGSKLLGEYSSKIAYGQNKLQVKFTRLIRPDGSSIVLPNQQGVDDQGVAGFEDQVDNHWGKVLGAGAMMTVFNIPGIVAQHQLSNNVQPITSSDGTVIGVRNSVGQTVATSSLESFGKATSQIGSDITRKSLDIQPTILVDSGYHFSIMVTKDIVLPPAISNSAVP